MTMRCLHIMALGLLLGGCATWPSSAPESMPAAPTSVARPYAETIELAGRLSVQYQHNGRDEAVHGSFTWAQTPAHTTLTLLSPLGQTMAVIQLTPDQATLLQAGQPPRVARDADALAASALGWPLPIAGLRLWLQGFALDAQGQPWTASAPGNTEVTTQDGWHLRYASWQKEPLANGTFLPRRLDLTRATTQAGLVSMRIVIDTWQTN